ncbi:ABC-type spermidine/putrescine transport system, ATPase component [Sphaerochaeta pleomorpha str. Grapes]|uniref:ABC-type spermidine/putrescine transport system, ATPase component n=1 Tax=Sphaerochaeta pleomorpha (strain ATCC BAA-1885 / DSM 22778 / Grapes) TaxID=158190 RepID=G8QTP0_SPHPG|nr:ATP-binding cassette domain-containing protein [Sphaerochaeta pleomorpha]AEV28005.1 ABC-type spermidine/putrescine transport system, ATPase component [Sphaerochaeta pleomorpha str. Grapes]
MSVTLVNISKVFTDQDDKTKEFTAVSNVNIEIKEGEMVTFLGPSGCGKTTTLRIISGFENQTTGDVYIDGKLVNDLPANKRDSSMVFQSYAIFPHLSVADNIGFGLELKGMKKAQIKVEVDKIMQTMGLSSLGNRQPSQLSGGQQQRVALARAIVNKPRVLLFDEPLSNLDAKLREQMRTEIRRIQQKFGITSIYVTHDQAEAMTVSDRIMVMDKGIIQQLGTPFEIYSRPTNHFVADFIGRANFIPATVVTLDKEVTLKVGEKECAFPSFNKDLKVGKSATIVIRPEGLRIGKKEEGAFFRGKVTQAVYLGSTMEYEIAVPNRKEPVVAISYNPVLEGFYKIGDTVSLTFDPISAHVIS